MIPGFWFPKFIDLVGIYAFETNFMEISWKLVEFTSSQVGLEYLIICFPKVQYFDSKKREILIIDEPMGWATTGEK